MNARRLILLVGAVAVGRRRDRPAGSGVDHRRRTSRSAAETPWRPISSEAEAANSKTVANVPILNQIVPHTDYVANCQAAVSSRRTWSIPLTVIGAWPCWVHWRCRERGLFRKSHFRAVLRARQRVVNLLTRGGAIMASEDHRRKSRTDEQQDSEQQDSEQQDDRPRTEKPEVTDEHKEKAQEMRKEYVEERAHGDHARQRWHRGGHGRQRVARRRREPEVRGHESAGDKSDGDDVRPARTQMVMRKQMATR